MSSLTFINAIFLSLIVPIIFIPVIIHLLNKKFPSIFHFSSIHFIKAALRRKSQLFRLRDWILTILRILILIILIFVFSKPNMDVFGTAKSADKKREIIILFDNSLSMQYEGGGISPFNKGIIEIEKMMNTTTGSDIVNIVNVGAIPIPMEGESTLQISNLKTHLRNLKPKNSTADFKSAIAWALTHFQAKSNQKELYIVSDFQRQTWSKTQLPQFEGNCYYINVGVINGENTAVINANLENSILLKGEDIHLETTICNYSGKEKTIPVNVYVSGIKIISENITLKPWSTNQKTFVFQLNKTGNFSGYISIPDDNLIADNQYYFSINIKEKEKILILTDEDSNPSNPAFFLSKALNPFGKNEGNYLTEPILLSKFNPIALIGIEKLFISRIGKLSADHISYIKQFLLNGGSIVYFLDGQNEGENLKNLEIAFENTPLPARISVKQSASSLGSGARRFMKGDFKSPYLKIFDGPNREKLSHLKFYEYYLSAVNDEKGVLLYFDDNSPALFREYYGNGKILFFNFSANELESNIARYDVFPVWIQEITRNLTSAHSSLQNYELYQTALISLDSTKPQESKIYTPDKKLLTDLNIASQNQNKIKIKLEQQGVYKVVLPQKEELIAVNITGLESDIRSIDLDRFSNTSSLNKPINVLGGSEDYKAIKEGVPLYHYVAIILLLMISFEAGVQLLFKGKT